MKDLNIYNCPYCNKECLGITSLHIHETKCLKNPLNSTIYTCEFCNRQFNYINSYSLHKKVCTQNLNRTIRKGHPVSLETREKISNGMKKAAQEGRNKGWATTRNNSQKKSYPEIWFSEVIKKEIEDKKYIYNMPFFTWKLDFAWPLKKICVEIDGSQHRTLETQIESDKRKDKKLLEEGWVIIRGDWQTIFNNPKPFISKVKEIIDNSDLKNTEISVNKIIYYLDENLKLNKEKERKRNSSISWENRKDLILNCGINIFEYKSIPKIIEKTGLSKRQIYLTLKKYNINRNVYHLHLKNE